MRKTTRYEKNDCSTGFDALKARGGQKLAGTLVLGSYKPRGLPCWPAWSGMDVERKM